MSLAKGAAGAVDASKIGKGGKAADRASSVLTEPNVPNEPNEPNEPTVPTWVFGYGSLMWRPGFSPLAAWPAVLQGWHRAFCRYSFRHRGTPQQPGLVMGLREGGHCRGRVLRVAPAELGAVLAELDAREGDGYGRHALPLQAESPTGVQTVTAWTYLPRQEHPSYFGELPQERLLHLLRTGQGESGTTLDYLRNLLLELSHLGVREPAWDLLLAEASQPDVWQAKTR